MNSNMQYICACAALMNDPAESFISWSIGKCYREWKYCILEKMPSHDKVLYAYMLFFTELKWKALNAALFNHNMANGVNVMNADRHTGVFTLNPVKMCFY